MAGVITCTSIPLSMAGRDPQHQSSGSLAQGCGMAGCDCLAQQRALALSNFVSGDSEMLILTQEFSFQK